MHIDKRLAGWLFVAVFTGSGAEGMGPGAEGSGGVPKTDGVGEGDYWREGNGVSSHIQGASPDVAPYLLTQPPTNDPQSPAPARPTIISPLMGVYRIARLTSFPPSHIPASPSYPKPLFPFQGWRQTPGWK